MSDWKPTREEAHTLLAKYIQRPSLVRHSIIVEAAMRHFATKFDEDVEKWGIIGLLHDLDYEKYPDQHCQMTPAIFADENWPADWAQSIISHGWKICADVEPQHIMEKVLYTIDQLTGLIYATAKLRPSASVLDLKSKSVVKKWKDKAFAANVDREVITRGVEMLNMERADVITETILAMRAVAAEIGLEGTPQEA